MHYLCCSLVVLTVVAGGCAGRTLRSAPSLDLTTAHWADQDSPVTVSLRGLSAVDDDTCWASGAAGTVLRTIDGGDNWAIRPIRLPGADELDFRDVHAIDARSAIVMSAGEPARFYRTDDGGDAWTLVYSNETPGVFFDGMAFWNDRDGIAFSDPIDGRLLIVRTRDGGRSWTVIDASQAPRALDGEAGFAASGTGIATIVDDGGNMLVRIGLGGATGRPTARIARSDDGGETWTMYASPLATSASAGIFSMAFIDANRGVIVGGDYLDQTSARSNAAYTVDGGRNWRLVEKDQAPRGYRSVVCWCQSARALIAAGPTGSEYSNDDGRTWIPLSDTGWHVVSAARTGGAVWAAGNDGRIARLAPAR